MDAIVRGFLKEAYVLINGDIDANKKNKKLTKKIENKKKELKRILETMEDGTATETEIKSVNRLSKIIKKLEADKNNALVITLLYPGEEGNIEILKPLNLGNGKIYGVTSATTDFIENGLFKKRVIGEFGIKVSITDKDKANAFGHFLKKVLSGVFSSALKAPIDDISNVLTSSTASVFSSDIQDALKEKKDDKITVVGASATAKFKIESNGQIQLSNPGEDGVSYANGKLTFDLKTTGLLRKTINTYKLIDADNGKVTLVLKSEPV